MKSDLVLTIPFQLDVQIAEKLLGTLWSQDLVGRQVVLDFQACARIDIGSGARLGNGFRRIASVGSLVVVLATDDFDQSPSKGWFLKFTRSGLGLAIARYATTVLSGNRDVREALVAYYRRTIEVPAQNSVYFVDLHQGRLDVSDESRFMRNLLAQFHYLNLSATSFDKQALGSLSAMCFEAVQNVVDHSAKKPLPPDTSILSYLALRYYKRTTRPEEGTFSRYIRHVQEQFGSDTDVRFLEIIVNDDGVGIPGREAQSLEIYLAPLAQEQAALEKALINSNVKVRAKDSQIRGGVAGQGYRRIRESLKKLSAYASLRTGRCNAFLDGLSPIQSEFRFTPGQHGLALSSMPGTTLQIVVPFRPSGENDLGQESLF